MANITIPNLPQAVSIDGAEQLLGVQSGTSKSITTGQIVSLVTGGGGTTPLVVAAGGTGNTTFDTYGVLYGDGTNPIESITPPTGSNYILVASPGTIPAWQENIPVTAGVNSISFGSTGLTPSTATEGIVTVAGTLVAASGGTGQSSYTIGDLLYASSSTALSKLADVATGSVLISGGVGAAPSYSASPTLTTSLTTPLLIGGTTASSSLTLQSTSGVGTSDSIAFKVGSNGATTAMTINTSGNVGIGTTSPSAQLNVSGSSSTDMFRITQTGTGNSFVVEDSTNPDTTPFVIDASGRLNIGSLNWYASGGITPSQQFNGTGQGASLALNAWQTGTNTAARLSFNRGDSATVGDFTDVVDSGDQLGVVSFSGADGVAFIEAARIESAVDGTPGTNDMPGRLVFSTTADGASTPIERLRISSTGNVGIGSTSLTITSLRVTKDITGGPTAYGVFSDGEIQSDVTSSAVYFGTDATAVSGTMNNLIHYRALQSSLGTATVSNQHGFYSDNDLIGATANYAFNAANTAAVTAGKTAYGFRSGVNTATGGGTTYGFYAEGTADNVFLGDTRIGSVVAPTKTLDITGTLGVSGAVTFSTALPVASGGTGATTSNAALTNLTEFTSTATAGATTTLTNTSTYFQFFTGTLTQTITLPVTSTLGTGWTFHIVNNSTGNLTVNSSGANLVITVLPGTTVMCTCIGTALTTAADWEAGYTDFTTATGTGSVVLSASPTLTGTTTATTLSATTLTATAGAGFQNMEVLTSGASWSLPAALQVTGAKFKITVIGGGGGGGGNAATAATSGAGGGGGGLAVAYLTYVSGQNSVTTSFGAAGAGASNTAGTAGGATTATYNSLTYIGTGGSGGAIGATAAGGAGGTGTTGTGAATFSLSGQNGGNAGTTTAVAGVTYLDNSGGGTGLGWGNGGRMPFAGATGSAGNSATGFGGGGSGSTAGSTATARAGGAGQNGAIIIEY
jgi:hypothetical protein